MFFEFLAILTIFVTFWGFVTDPQIFGFLGFFDYFTDPWFLVKISRIYKTINLSGVLCFYPFPCFNHF